MILSSEEQKDIIYDREEMNIGGSIPQIHFPDYIYTKLQERCTATSFIEYTVTIFGNISYSLSERFERDIKKLKFGERIVKLKKPLKLKFNFENNVYEVVNEEFGLFAISDDLKKAIEIISEKFEILYDVYVNDTSMELTRDAVELREKLKEYI